MARPSQATLLQFLTLTNGREFAAAIERSAAFWSEREPDPAQRMTTLYRMALLRDPRTDELALAQADPSDLIWALVLQPEFQLIH